MVETIADLEEYARKMTTRANEGMRRLYEAGLRFDDWQPVIDDPDFRSRLVVFWQSGGRLPQETVLALTEPEQMAIRILGKAKVTTAAQYARAWGVELTAEVPLRYTEADLAKAALMNQQGTADWRLAYCRGLSLRSQHQLLGVNPRRQPCFHKDWNWWLDQAENDWANQSLAPGYYLLDVTGRFNYTAWAEQDTKIAKLGTELAIELSRAPEQAVAEAVFTTFKVTGERLLANWYHWGSSRASHGFRVFVGCFGRDGLYVYFGNPDYAVFGLLRVVLLWKFRD